VQHLQLKLKPHPFSFFSIFLLSAALTTVCSLGGVVERAHDVVVTVDVKLLLVGQDHLAATVLRKEYSVADLDHDWSRLAVIEGLAWANSDDCADVELLLLARGKDDATLGLRQCLSLLDDYAVEQWSDCLECEHSLNYKFM